MPHARNTAARSSKPRPAHKNRSHQPRNSQTSKGKRNPYEQRSRHTKPAAPKIPFKTPQTPATSFAKTDLPDRLVTTLARRGIANPFAIQAATLPDALAGEDILGRADTGSGKTLAFGLPVLARAQRGKPQYPTALIIVPTRELVRQVVDVLAPLAQPLGLRLAAVYGGAPIYRQISSLRGRRDIVIATPGRLLDLLERQAIFLDDVAITVLDEADQLCDLGFLPDIQKLLAQVPSGGQTMLFSATLDGDVDNLVREFLPEPVLIEVAPKVAAGPVAHHVVNVDSHTAKTTALLELAAKSSRALLFVRTRNNADQLTNSLVQKGIQVHALHAGLAQSARNRALKAFTAGQASALVATDVAARGLHIDNVDLVVHVDPPDDIKSFVHRSGRTGRAGASGTVVTMVLPTQQRFVKKLLTNADVTISTEEIALSVSASPSVKTSPVTKRTGRPRSHQDVSDGRKPRHRQSAKPFHGQRRRRSSDK